ncbi:GDP-mannose 4,6-dehydratase [Piscinibacterium candidicorallinum]|uniref:GDP-mannose 4,6-dehydratase n=1 Tax=Piscinibacterium candidicorallinum TaxID=1793872 RepID=A0ABV7H911_9BURK
MASPGKRRALITGRTGFTGSHLAHYLSQRGWEVFGLDEVAESSSEPGASTDINDKEAVVRRLSDVRPTYIVHLAAHSHVVGDPIAFFRVNLLGTESLMEAILASGCTPEKVLVASSANVYGNADRSPISEEAPLRPMNHYALSKASMELMLHKWHARLPIIVTRPFNYTGPGQSEAFVMPKIVHAFYRRDPVIRLGNLDVARDLSDVRFVCEAYLRLLQSPITGQTVNVCSGSSIHLLRVLDLLREISGGDPRIEVDPAFVRRDEIKDLCGSPQRLFDAVGEIPVVSHRDILAHMYRSLGEGEPPLKPAGH